MSDRGPVIVHDDGGSNAAAFGIVVILAVAILIGLFAWHPWSITSTTRQTTVTQPNSQGGNQNSSTTTTTTNTNDGHP
ncbi:MAG TPA: hypothetical protein VMF11_04375 [Candidatus Baltobacteraceae bacterium]|nr:hypothetical protein [Candidatus Baltobacteraceae bacterium]